MVYKIALNFLLHYLITEFFPVFTPHTKDFGLHKITVLPVFLSCEFWEMMFCDSPESSNLIGKAPAVNECTTSHCSPCQWTRAAGNGRGGYLLPAGLDITQSGRRGEYNFLKEMLAFKSPGGVSFAYAALSQIQGSLCPLLQTGLQPTFFCQICLTIFISHQLLLLMEKKNYFSSYKNSVP